MTNAGDRFVAGMIDSLKGIELTRDQGLRLVDAVGTSVREPVRFYGEGIAPLLVAEQKKLDLKADAERLAELRGEYGDLRVSGERDDGSGNPEHMAHLACLIAVYEECAARGLTFGGRR